MSRILPIPWISSWLTRELNKKLTPLEGKLADVAPTILSALGLPQPELMDGSTLLPGRDWGGRRRVLLLILDGWGIGKQDASNPIFLAKTPVWDELLQNSPHSRLQASG